LRGIVQRNLVTRVKGNEESTYRQGDVNLTPADLGAVNKDFSIYSIASTPYTGSELIPMRAGSDNVYTSINTLASQIGGGSGSEQTALVNYKKIISNVGGTGSFSQTFQDSNITGDMVLLEAHLDDPSIQTSDWTVTCSDSNGGQVIISGSANGTTAATLYFGVGMSTTPTILTNLESNSADNLLKANPRPGVTGVLGPLNGGTGVSATDAADLRSKLDITPVNIGAVPISGTSESNPMTGNLVGTGFYARRAGETIIEAKNTNTGLRVLLDSSDSKNGIWSSGYWNGSSAINDGKWILYRDTDGRVYSPDLPQYTSGTWTPQLYDYNTYKRDLTPQPYFKIGNFCIMFIWLDNINYSNIDTMVQFRNLPYNCIGGTIYLATLKRESRAASKGTFIQGSGTRAYVRENVTSSDFGDPVNSGVTDVILFGYV